MNIEMDMNETHKEVVKHVNLNELRKIATCVEEEWHSHCCCTSIPGIATDHILHVELNYDMLDKVAIIPRSRYEELMKDANKNLWSNKEEKKEEVVHKSPKEVQVKDIRVYGDRIVVMYFSDGTYTKAVCTKNDAKEGKFDVDMGIIICLVRKIFGDNKKNKRLKHFINDMHKLMKKKENIRKKAAEDRIKAAQNKQLAQELADKMETESYEKDMECIKNAVVEALNEYHYIHKDDGGDDGK